MELNLEKRTIEIDRLYWLGDFRNIRFRDSLDISGKESLNYEIIETIKYMQTLSVEKSYRNYMLLQMELDGKFPKTISSEEMVKYIESLQLDTMEKIKLLIKNGEI